ncbi:MAG: proteasome accessory factor PafA2 family protein, partial [Actinomycetota bacterium]
KVVSHDPSCRATVELADGRKLTAVELQWEYLRLSRKYVEENGSDDVTDSVLELWEATLEALESDPMQLKDRLDWVAKLSLLEAYRSRDGLAWDASKLKMIDLQYHDVRRPKGLYYKLVSSGKMTTLVGEDEITWAIDHPPEDTRAYFRGECLRRFSDKIVAASWDALIFDTGAEPLRKVPTLEPTRGTKSHVQDLFDASRDADSLLANLSG